MNTGYEINEHKKLRRCPGRLLNVLYTFNLRPVSYVLSYDFFSWFFENFVFPRTWVSLSQALLRKEWIDFNIVPSWHLFKVNN